MTEREKVLLQREAARRIIKDWVFSGLTPDSEARIRQLFPLPPERVPNVVRGPGDWEYRVCEGRVERRNVNSFSCPRWAHVHSSAAEDAAIAEALAHPWVERPAEEE